LTEGPKSIPLMDSKLLAAVVDRACILGARRAEILTGCLIRPEVLDAPSQPIPSASAYLATTRAAELSGNRYICAEVSKEYDWFGGFESHPSLGDQPSLGDMLTAWFQFADSDQDGSTYYSLTFDALQAVLTGRRLLVPTQPPGQADAWDVSSWVQVFRDHLGPMWDNGQMRATVADPKAIPPASIPQDRVSKGDGMNISIQFPSPWLLKKTRRRIPLTHVGSETKRRDIDLTAVFETFDYANWRGTDAFAHFLGFHPKTLQRMLAEKGTSCARLKDTAQSRLALEWMVNPQLSFREIGQRLGYSNGSAFTRAFQRWFGTSPNDWRVRQQRL
jgi:AraC-like DNA-binding protein